MKLYSNRYGKAKIRVLKKLHQNGTDTFKELEVKVILEGRFDAAYTAGDNREIVATDTMKNTVNVFAYEKLGLETEPFVVELAAHFLDKYPQIEAVEIETGERLWERISVDGSPSRTNFAVTGKMIPTTQVTRSRNHLGINSGIRELVILKSAGSAFSGFHRDEFTTLPETEDRLLATVSRVIGVIVRSRRTIAKPMHESSRLCCPRSDPKRARQSRLACTKWERRHWLRVQKLNKSV
jgi:urate oxidase